MRSSFSPNRVKPGVPAGGQFAPINRPEATSSELSDSSSVVESFIADRRERIRSGGFVQPAAIQMAFVDPRSSAHVREWWEVERATAEYGHESGSYPQMPDDYTPSGSAGNAISGRRRTHRMAYSGAGVFLRMPSATSIRRYAAEIGGQEGKSTTFDVPVSSIYPGGEVTGWVRVTRSPDGSFATRGLGFSRESSAYVAEAVQCVLEARRPSRALAETGDILERRRQRAARIGTTVESIRSSWIKSSGYDKATGTMVVTTATHQYGYKVPAEVFTKVTESMAPGGVFNQLVRGRAKRVEVRQCALCQRFTADMDLHRCPPKEAQRQVVTPLQNELSRQRFQRGF